MRSSVIAWKEGIKMMRAQRWRRGGREGGLCEDKRCMTGFFDFIIMMRLGIEKYDALLIYRMNNLCK